MLCSKLSLPFKPVTINSAHQNLPVEMHKPEAHPTQCQLYHMFLKQDSYNTIFYHCKSFNEDWVWLLCTTTKHCVNMAAEQETVSHWNPTNLLNTITPNIFKLLLYPNFDYNKIWFKSTSWKKVSKNKVSHSHALLKFNIYPQGNISKRPENYELGRDTLPQLSEGNITNKGGALSSQRVMEYKITDQIVKVSATTLKIYVADFLPATGNSTENRPRGTATLTFKNRASYIQDGRTATLQLLHFIYFFNKYKSWVF
jgi:hypothetical protein